MYSQDPLALQNNLTEISNKLYGYMDKLNGTDYAKEEELVMPDEDKLTEAQKYYYYQQLSDPAKKIYVTIENNIEKLKNGEENIPLPSSINEYAKNNENGKELVAKEFQNAWDAFMTDKSEYFYIDSSKVCLVSKITTRGSNTTYEFSIGKGEHSNYFIDEFDTVEEVNNAIAKVEEMKQEVLANATGTNYEKVLYVHDYIVNNTKYETAKTENTSNIYGTLINEAAICEGYARTFKYLLDELEIPCVLVSGIGVDENGKTERHAWNYVYLNNSWYAVDTTWDDPIIIGTGIITDNIKYKYFLKGKNSISTDHTTIGNITKDGFEFEYPVLNKEDYK